MKYLAHSASFHSPVNNAPSKPGIKQLILSSRQGSSSIRATRRISAPGWSRCSASTASRWARRPALRSTASSRRRTRPRPTSRQAGGRCGGGGGWGALLDRAIRHADRRGARAWAGGLRGRAGRGKGDGRQADPHRPSAAQRPLTRQTTLPRSSAISSAPVRSTATPTGRPRARPCVSRKPVTTSRALPLGRPPLNGTQTTL